MGYTLCFIRQGNNILLLNREKPRWMGSWNGIGGKLEENETPTQCIIREVYEEAGLGLDNIKYKGYLNRITNGQQNEKIYIFVADLSEDYVYTTPKKTVEGILDWKSIPWIMHPENTGVAVNIPKFLNVIFQKDEIYEHLCVFENNLLVDYRTKIINEIG